MFPEHVLYSLLSAILEVTRAPLVAVVNKQKAKRVSTGSGFTPLASGAALHSRQAGVPTTEQRSWSLPLRSQSAAGLCFPSEVPERLLDEEFLREARQCGFISNACKPKETPIT